MILKSLEGSSNNFCESNTWKSSSIRLKVFEKVLVFFSNAS